jgi:hypothetical protein
MTSVLKDQNRVPVWFGLSSVDGTTIVPIQINSATGKVKYEDGVSVLPVITNGIPKNAVKDSNYQNCILGQSSTNSAVYLPVSVNPNNGAIQIKTT